MSSGTEYRTNFTLIRWCAAAFVISGHACILNGASVPVILGNSVHSIGVYIFFLLGGYFISHSWQKDPNFPRYFTKRFLRIWPPLAAVVLGTIFIVGPIFTTLPLRSYFTGGCFSYLRNLALFPMYSLPGVFEANIYSNAVNGSLWTLPIEVAMYFVIPFLFAVMQLLKCSLTVKRCVMAFLAAACCTGDIILLNHLDLVCVVYGSELFSAMHILPFYFIGMALSLFDIKRYANLPLAVIAVLLLSSLNLSASATKIALYFVLPYFVFSLGYDDSPVWQRFRKVPEITYGIYLFGFLVQQCIANMLVRLGLTIPTPVFYVVSFAVSVILAYLLFCIVEKPIQKLSKNLQAGMCKKVPRNTA